MLASVSMLGSCFKTKLVFILLFCSINVGSLLFGTQ